MKSVLLSLCSLFFAAGAAFAQIPEEPEVHEFNTLPKAPLLYLDDTVVTVGQFGDYLFNSGLHPSGVHDRDLDTLRTALESCIDEIGGTRDLDSAAIMSDPTSRRRVRWRMAHRAGPVLFMRLIAPRVTVSQAEIEQMYHDSLKTAFTAPSKREVRQILIAPKLVQTPDGKYVRGKQEIQTALALADSLKAALLNGASFDELAGAFSDDSASRAQNGYLGWIYPGNTAYDFDTAAFAARAGEIRGPVKTLYGYHLIKVEQIRPESTLALNDSLTVLIRRQLQFVKGRSLGTAWADSAMAAGRWQFNDPAIERVPDVDTGAWMTSINSRDTLWWEEWKGAWELYKHSRGIEGPGTAVDKQASLKQCAFPYLYLQTAEDLGFADDTAIVAEHRQFLKSEALRTQKQRLRNLQEPPADLVDPSQGLPVVHQPDKPLHLQRIQAADTASIWGAYRSLLAGMDIRKVARRYNDNMHEALSGGFDLGWVGQADLPVELWGKVWILEPGRFTRPIEYESTYYIFRLVDRFQVPQPQEVRNKQIDSVRVVYRARGLEEWRAQIRAGHHIRLDKSYWNRVQQLWRP
jgi:parvulin-like peptidyl-prolyl isomerase